jgi:hypothetical protein
MLVVNIEALPKKPTPTALHLEAQGWYSNPGCRKIQWDFIRNGLDHRNVDAVDRTPSA